METKRHLVRYCWMFLLLLSLSKRHSFVVLALSSFFVLVSFGSSLFWFCFSGCVVSNNSGDKLFWVEAGHQRFKAGERGVYGPSPHPVLFWRCDFVARTSSLGEELVPELVARNQQSLGWVCVETNSNTATSENLLSSTSSFSCL